MNYEIQDVLKIHGFNQDNQKPVTQMFTEESLEVEVLRDFSAKNGYIKKKGEREEFLPLFVQSCMNPGKWKVYPVVLIRRNQNIEIFSYDKAEVYREKDIILHKKEYRLQEKREKKGCIPCKNCGRC